LYQKLLKEDLDSAYDSLPVAFIVRPLALVTTPRFNRPERLY